ncbi:aspartate racemase [[Clostridium] sordellii]|uniref:aspartate/glutamate racemase family protein n=1 Tax=Paraclostridium sordellii TaxID=1505 RepID=UPI0005E7B606|nr:amino acid racemase [Paeniclostridium sordellii]CEP95729.1 aspartate racemase [[Clostridium] sordellii] [Paeniclostridium sordellii]
MKTVGIIGGMGTLATIDLFNKIVIETDAKSDKEHIHILIDNNTQIPDRTSFILGKGEDPTNEILKSAKNLEKIGADFLAIPCNTAHYFYETINLNVEIDVINMIEETAKSIKLNKINKVGLLATTGTIKASIYEGVFNKYDIEIITPNYYGQRVIMEFIYEIKEGNVNFDKEAIKNVFDYFRENNISIILGCTELPVGVKMLGIEGEFIDPTSILAKACVKKAKEKIIF